MKFYGFLNVIFGYSLNDIMNNDHTCLFQCINISRVSRKQFKPWPGGFGFKAMSNVHA